MKIFGWMADLQGCGYYRLAMPLWGLQKLGHEVGWTTRMPTSVQTGAAEVIVAQRTCQPAPSALWQRLAREGRAKLVFELDDDFWHVDPTNRPASAFFTEERLARMVENIRVADLVTVTTDELADVVSQWNSHVKVLPNYVPAKLLDHERIHNDRLTIGWGGGTSHRTDFGEVAAPLRRVLQRFADLTEFHNIGEDFTERVASRRGLTRYSPWQPTVEGYYRSLDFDIGLAPLKATRFNESKSDIKLVEYAALGIPAVVSDVGPYRRAIDAGAPALPAVSHREFEAHLNALVSDEEYRSNLGKQAREWAASRTIEANAHRWEAAYAG